jgi:hypothetical protein
MDSQNDPGKGEGEMTFRVPQPKYDVGDVVFVASIEAYRKGESCPDCLETKEWHVILPNGEQFEIPCSTCTHGFNGSSGRISHQDYLAWANRITIAQVRIDTAHKESPVSYMAEETGFPSGAVHYESRLFSTEEEAVACAKEMAARQRECVEQHRIEQAERDKKKVRYKPSWEKRRIRELEKQVKAILKKEKEK